MRVWHDRKASVKNEVPSAEHRAKSIQQKLDRLDDAFIYKESIDLAGKSAKTTNRPEFLRPPAACKVQRGRLNAVVVYSLTRFSRNSADHHAIVSLLRGLGIALKSVTEPIDDSPS